MSSVAIDTVNLFQRRQGFDPGKTDHAGFRLQKLTTTQRDALTGEGAAVAGDHIYNTTDAAVQAYTANGWVTPAQAAEVTFTETSGAGTYTGSVAIPAGATILDIIINGVALWNNAGACTLKVGDVADDDGYFTGVDLKATDLLAGESLSFALAGGKAGAYIANSQVSPRYSASARTISGIITTASTGGSTGRTRMTVVWTVAAPATAATKV